MKKASNPSLSELRKKAKKILQELENPELDFQNLDTQNLLEELNVYHIELELQNEELQKTRNKLEASQRYLDDLFAFAPVGYLVMSVEGRIEDANQTAARYFRVQRSFLKGQRLQSFVPHSSFIEFNNCLTSLVEHNKPQYAKVQFRVHDGIAFWGRIDMFLIDNSVGSGKLVLCSIHDITATEEYERKMVDLNLSLESIVAERTESLNKKNEELYREIEERQKAEDEARKFAESQRVLLREIHHRVKNNMQIVVSLLKLQSKQISNPDAVIALNDSQNRVRALATIHEILYQAEDLSMIPFAQYLNKLIRHLSVAYNISQKNICIKSTIQIPTLHIDQAVPIGLITTELITNSIKYAFTESGGNISLSARFSDPNLCELVVSDDGIGLPSEVYPEQCETLGLRLTHRLAQDQLGGNMEINSNNGTDVIVRFTRK